MRTAIVTPVSGSAQFFVGVQESAARFIERDGKTYLIWPTADLATRICKSTDDLHKAMNMALKGEKKSSTILCLRTTFHRQGRQGQNMEVEVSEQHRWYYDAELGQVIRSQ